MSILVDFEASRRLNSFVTRKFTKKVITATLESFAIGQVVRIAPDPLRLQTGDQNKGGVVLRKASFEEYAKQNPSARSSHNEALIASAQFYEVGID